jgi:hypothetical protein
MVVIEGRQVHLRQQYSVAEIEQGIISHFFDPLCFPEWDPRTNRVTRLPACRHVGCAMVFHE